MKLRLNTALSAVMVLGLSLLAGDSQAVDVNIRITGEIYIPPCIINGGATLHIPFQKLALQEIDGLEYRYETRTVPITCEWYEGRPYIRIDGPMLGGGAPDNVLRTTGANPDAFGIALYQGNSVDSSHRLRLGAGEQGKYGYQITKGLSPRNSAASNFTFTAVPYKLSGKTLVPGAFNAAMTMAILYL